MSTKTLLNIDCISTLIRLLQVGRISVIIVVIIVIIQPSG